MGFFSILQRIISQIHKIFFILSSIMLAWASPASFHRKRLLTGFAILYCYTSTNFMHSKVIFLNKYDHITFLITFHFI